LTTNYLSSCFACRIGCYIAGVDSIRKGCSVFKFRRWCGTAVRKSCPKPPNNGSGASEVSAEPFCFARSSRNRLDVTADSRMLSRPQFWREKRGRGKCEVDGQGFFTMGGAAAANQVGVAPRLPVLMWVFRQGAGLGWMFLDRVPPVRACTSCLHHNIQHASRLHSPQPVFLLQKQSSACCGQFSARTA
jgi:hypothetical protein